MGERRTTKNHYGIGLMMEYDKELDKVQGNNETILVVEDDLALREAMKEMLGGNGYKVLTAVGSHEAMSIFERNESIRVVLSDLSLPKVDGLELLERIKEARKGVRVILASGFVADEQKEEMARKGIDLFLQKPYTPLELLTMVQRALNGH